MNQRLEELARQAGLESFYVEYSPWQVEFEKFAQLIVQECIDTVLDSSVEYATRPQIADELKEHFGVE